MRRSIRGSERGGAPREDDEADVEVQAPWRGRHNFSLNSSSVLRDAYRLLCVVAADRSIATMATSMRDPLAQLRARFVEDELVHTLISLAVMNRTQDDHMSGPRNDPAELSFRHVSQTCGVLIDNLYPI